MVDPRAPRPLLPRGPALTGTLQVFAYGSLMVDPPRADALEEVTPAWLTGWRRAFEKRSLTRGCTEADAPLGPAVEGWTDGRRRVSLCLGVHEVQAGAVRGERVHGLLLRWPAAVAREVRTLLDRREGVGDPPRPTDGYTATVLPIDREEGTWPGLTYVSRPGPWHAPDLDETTVAAILLAATPRVRGERALGADYLLDTVAALASRQVVDPGLEALAARVRPVVEAARSGA
ncbi:MAG: gamma-glutamylcyclotransferase [Alphaproteobacteria bacterium]|nr:gamma-glutamylcyclotransferase [Alphaproteobacteria bacterium]